MVALAILAAGRGTRMKSSLPKVLHELGGRTMLERVLDSCAPIDPVRQVVIVGYEADRVRAALSHREEVEFVEQREQLGTGHAVQQLLGALEDYAGELLVLNGDLPLVRSETLAYLLETHQTHRNAATLLTAQLDDPTGYGRVFCDLRDRVECIIEHRDCTPEQRRHRRINAGAYCFDWLELSRILPRLSNDNQQQEYYLTDVFPLLKPVMAVDVADAREINGINNRLQMSAAYDILQERIKAHWMLAGVTMIDPSSITIDDSVVLHPDVVIEPQTHLRGTTEIGSGCRIGPGSYIENSRLGEGVQVLYSVITDSEIETGTRVGPYAHLRGQAKVGAGCRIGNFVEVKNSEIGDKTNAAHLSYLGDATLGTQVNIGAGTVTANYNGVRKHRTTIGDRSKTGSNCVLVAPIHLGADVTVAAGSTVTEDVPDDALVVARQRQVVKPGWRQKTEQEE
ncbi:UDP-N-acetylglucosamine diphosphorylase/glucosamine-1-phosphate N-acetyltransferase [Rubidibacter lacunae KORDI 51-2]|uniref:Bifunctional protein GlmU n=1 Tax=Rubidibacter lacunae KORDI 51-2 TaxID=582515 RepID=U5DPL3_9CHRO|nr:bifunctional UDP-N-acetylglucosamine diphosphorylase/glucosamine-1-phosphate N-acetyltransferase GlmU [Rubidibacter lacunae]ERN41625.1 UDP-N-acetylglucosamine diphosphorylase/glucosamine-1-phosphate N-acetyltransferase [Rubidibacter lacunae KORDI 51-2]